MEKGKNKIALCFCLLSMNLYPKIAGCLLFMENLLGSEKGLDNDCC